MPPHRLSAIVIGSVLEGAVVMASGPGEGKGVNLAFFAPSGLDSRENSISFELVLRNESPHAIYVSPGLGPPSCVVSVVAVPHGRELGTGGYLVESSHTDPTRPRWLDRAMDIRDFFRLEPGRLLVRQITLPISASLRKERSIQLHASLNCWGMPEEKRVWAGHVRAEPVVLDVCSTDEECERGIDPSRGGSWSPPINR